MMCSLAKLILALLVPCAQQAWSYGFTDALLDDRNPSRYVQVLEEHESIGGGAPTLKRVYNYGLDLIRRREVPSGTTYYFIYDGHGSTRALADANGNIGNAFAYDAYGSVIASNGPSQTVYLYCGEQFDPHLGFYYLRARYVNPGTGRFWTMDTFEGVHTDPLSLHKYLYCHADPVNNSDPLGHTDLIQTLKATAIQLGFFTARWAAKSPKKTLVILDALSATGIFDGFPPGHPTPFDELAAFGRMIRGMGSAVRDTAAVARYQAALSVRAFFSKFWRQD
ncbi:MAG: RHS repeat-associated core domain-containing protein [Verrucomicrobiota bacterium]|nr:RHS repeat-associated core domain-containing protein [Limisphaera sp.]MDW8382133.1 RHS repeat-associated core domain-containing protein [Verrucomicrobiota bacterium]